MPRPNVIVLYCDDAGYGDFGFTGHPTIRTPNLDRIACEGAVGDQFYTVSPACTASRYGLLTGRYPRRSGFSWVLFPKDRRHLHSREVTIADMLRAAGYRTGIFGKWHLGVPNEENDFAPEALPLAHGFDRYIGLPYSNDMIPPNHPDLPLIESFEGGASPIPGYRVVEHNPDGTELTELYTRRLQEFIRESKGQPFFGYLPYAMPHVPLTPGKAFAGRSIRGLYGDAIEEIDWSVGQIVQTLREEGIAEDTILIFASDNGPWLIKGLEAGSSGLFRDGKGSTWEGGVRVPFVAWSPGRIGPGQRLRDPFATIDLMPTIAAWAGCEPPTSCDGRDVSALFRGESLPERSLALHGPDQRVQAVRRGPWKYHRRTNSQLKQDYFASTEDLLFQIENDPSETINLADRRPDLVEAFHAWCASQDEALTGYWD